MVDDAFGVVSRTGPPSEALIPRPFHHEAKKILSLYISAWRKQDSFAQNQPPFLVRIVGETESGKKKEDKKELLH